MEYEVCLNKAVEQKSELKTGHVWSEGESVSPPAPGGLHSPAVGSYFPKPPTEPKTDWFEF